MPEVTDYSVDEKELPMFVPIMSPRVGRLRIQPQIFCLRVKSPN